MAVRIWQLAWSTAAWRVEGDVEPDVKLRQGRAGSREAAPRARTGLLAVQNECAVGAAVLLAAECRFTTIRNDPSRPSVCVRGFV